MPHGLQQGRQASVPEPPPTLLALTHQCPPAAGSSACPQAAEGGRCYQCRPDEMGHCSGPQGRRGAETEVGEDAA